MNGLINHCEYSYVILKNRKIKALLATKRVNKDGEILYKVFEPEDYSVRTLRKEDIIKIVDLVEQEEYIKKFYTLLNKFVVEYCQENFIKDDEIKLGIYYTIIECLNKEYGRYLDKFGMTFIDYIKVAIKVLIKMYFEVKEHKEDELAEIVRIIIYEIAVLQYLCGVFNYQEIYDEIVLEPEFIEERKKFRDIAFKSIYDCALELKEILN